MLLKLVLYYWAVTSPDCICCCINLQSRHSFRRTLTVNGVSIRQWNFSLPPGKVNIVRSGEASPSHSSALSVLVLNVLFKSLCYINSWCANSSISEEKKATPPRSTSLSKIDSLHTKATKRMDNTTLTCTSFQLCFSIKNSLTLKY